MKIRFVLIVYLILFLSLMISACSPKLPKEIETILEEHYSYTSYDIVSFQKAPYPENYPGPWGTLAGKNEVWCIIIQTPDWGISPKIFYRLGELWEQGGVSAQQFFNQLGCTNYQ